MKKPPAIFLFGPTASGKTDLACFLLDSLKNLEIVSVDSALIYKGMNIGTAKPNAKILKKYPHHLIDCIEPTESFSAARFQQEALLLMQQITQRGNVPLLVGGTMLYLISLLEGLSPLPCADPNIRAQIDEKAKKYGWAALHADLNQIDPLSAQRLNPNDSQRIQRALEVFYISQKPLSAWLNEPKTPLPFEHLNIGLNVERPMLHHKIAQRFEQMLKNGLVEEVEGLRQKYILNAQMPSMRCVGYRQVWQMLEGTIKKEELLNKGIFATRQLAKRQITWMNNRLKHQRFDAEEKHAVCQSIQHFLEKFG